MKMSFDIPDAKAGDMINGVCKLTGWTTESGKTKAAWVKGQTVQWLKETAKRGLLKASQETINAEIDPVTIT